MSEGGPCDVWFYHLERSALDQVLPDLLEKTIARGWRAVVRARERDRIDHLDGWLWSWREDSFLPHGTEEDGRADRQPIWLTTELERPNGAHVLFILDGAECGPLDDYQRCVMLFDGNDEAALAEARGRWKTFKAQGLPISYWRQTERGWEKQA